jgi:multidrug transporter EmrE-like cation transporter
MQYVALILLGIGGLILTIGDIFMKNWVSSSKNIFYVIGLGIYIIGLNFLAFSFKYKNIAVASVIFVLFNVITLALVSWLYFKEPLNTFQIIGIVLGLGAVILLEFS